PFREPQKVLERAEACIAQCQEHGFASEREWSIILRGWGIAKQGQVEEGIAQIRASLQALHAARNKLGSPYFLALLAETLEEAGQLEQGLATVDEALDFVRLTGERWWAAELHRLKGELLLKTDSGSQPTEAEECFQQALEIARLQLAKSWELRAVMSLARLW